MIKKNYTIDWDFSTCEINVEFFFTNIEIKYIDSNHIRWSSTSKIVQDVLNLELKDTEISFSYGYCKEIGLFHLLLNIRKYNNTKSLNDLNLMLFNINTKIINKIEILNKL